MGEVQKHAVAFLLSFLQVFAALDANKFAQALDRRVPADRHLSQGDAQSFEIPVTQLGSFSVCEFGKADL